MNKELITVINNNGVEVQAEVLNAFTADKTGKKYVVYTLNEENEKGMVLIYIAQMVEVDGNYNLVAIEDQAEWDMVKDIMKKMARGE